MVSASKADSVYQSTAYELINIHFRPLPNLVPGSDMAGEIISLGDDVKGWKIGDRVSPNFCLDHIYGPSTREIQATALGASVQGVLTQYKIVPAHVSISCSYDLSYRLFHKSLVKIPDHLSYEEASTLPYVYMILFLEVFNQELSDVLL